MAEKLKIIVLGASSGIGREMALCFARDGHRVGVAARRMEPLGELEAAHPRNIVPAAFDATAVEALPARLDELASALGGLDAFAVCAGWGDLNPDLSASIELDAARINVESFTASTTWAYRRFKKQGSGRLAAITSVGGLVGEASAPAYSASKAYQIMYLESLRKRAKAERARIAITDLRPGSVDTAMMKGEGHFWISDPRAAAELACRAIMAKKRLQYISRRWAAVGWLLRLLHVFS